MEIILGIMIGVLVAISLGIFGGNEKTIFVTKNGRRRAVRRKGKILYKLRSSGSKYNYYWDDTDELIDHYLFYLFLDDIFDEIELSHSIEFDEVAYGIDALDFFYMETGGEYEEPDLSDPDYTPTTTDEYAGEEIDDEPVDDSVGDFENFEESNDETIEEDPTTEEPDFGSEPSFGSEPTFEPSEPSFTPEPEPDRSSFSGGGFSDDSGGNSWDSGGSSFDSGGGFDD